MHAGERVRALVKDRIMGTMRKEKRRTGRAAGAESESGTAGTQAPFRSGACPLPREPRLSGLYLRLAVTCQHGGYRRTIRCDRMAMRREHRRGRRELWRAGGQPVTRQAVRALDQPGGLAEVGGGNLDRAQRRYDPQVRQLRVSPDVSG